VTARNTTQQDKKFLLSKNLGYLMEVTAIRVTVIRVTVVQNVTRKRSLESAPNFKVNRGFDNGLKLSEICCIPNFNHTSLSILSTERMNHTVWYNYTQISNRIRDGINFATKSIWKRIYSCDGLCSKHKFYYIFEPFPILYLFSLFISETLITKNNFYSIENTNFTTFRWLKYVVKLMFSA